MSLLKTQNSDGENMVLLKIQPDGDHRLQKILSKGTVVIAGMPQTGKNYCASVALWVYSL
ncbi:MAG: hypothetical protein ABDK94_04445 [Atribacterota bacterium]